MRFITRIWPGALAGAWLLALLATGSGRADLDPKLKEAEEKRIAAIEKVQPAVVAVFGPGGQGGGSGVLISEDGYALTNFHVTKTNPTMQCGLPDGVLYDAVLVGLDKVGDVSLIKLVPKKPGDKFPFAPLGDSDKVRAGDWSLAMGNPFLLATDFKPTVTYGMISGVHRYQYPSGTLLEYTDCIQIDTSINPGNSGGPLFNMNGELIGINGRGSFDKRTRINSGVGYAISINQIKNFLGHLKAGMDTDHATLGAVVESEADDGANPRILVKNLLEESDAARRRLDLDDELVSFAGRHVNSVNQYKNVLGLYPRGWRIPMEYRRNDTKTEVLVRLMGVQKQEINDDGTPKQPGAPQPRPGGPRPGGPRPGGTPVPTKPSPAMKFFEAKPGFINYYFNKQEKDRLWADFLKHGDFSKFKGPWQVRAAGEAANRATKMELSIRDEGTKTNCAMTILGLDYTLNPLETNLPESSRMSPPNSGGFLMAMFLYRTLLTQGEAGFKGGEFYHGGHEPFYMPPAKGVKPEYAALRVMCEVLRTRYAGTTTKWYFSLKDHKLVGFEVFNEGENKDPCEVYLLDYKEVGGLQLPGRIHVRYGSDPESTTGALVSYADLSPVEWGLAEK